MTTPTPSSSLVHGDYISAAQEPLASLPATPIITTNHQPCSVTTAISVLPSSAPSSPIPIPSTPPRTISSGAGYKTPSPPSSPSFVYSSTSPLLASVNNNNGNFDYYICVDFEATTDQYTPDNFIHEIIEFPLVLVNAKTLQIEDGLQIYVRPTLNPQLTPFCKQLTGISQETVNGGVLLEDALEQVHDWLLNKHKLVSHPLEHYYRNCYKPWFKFLFVTDGPSDFLTFLRNECYAKGIQIPCYYKAFCDAKQVFQQALKLPRKLNIKSMLNTIGQEFQGQEHSGIWDAYNLAIIVVYLLHTKVTLSISRKQDPPYYHYSSSNNNNNNSNNNYFNNNNNNYNAQYIDVPKSSSNNCPSPIIKRGGKRDSIKTSV